MTNDDVIAALERAASDLQEMAKWGRYRSDNERYRADAATLRAHADSLRSGGERAQIVAWLRADAGELEGAGDATSLLQSEAIVEIADAIEAGANMILFASAPTSRTLRPAGKRGQARGN